LMADDKTGYAVYEKVATDAGGNVAFAFIGFGIIWLISKFWLGTAKVLFWIAAAIMLLSVAHFLFVVAAGAVASIPRYSPTRNKWLWASAGARLFEQILSLTALWLAARTVGYLR
jgi:hypothetical protein